MVNKNKTNSKTNSRTSAKKSSKHVSSKKSVSNSIAFNNEIGINDPNGIHNNPLTGKPYENIYQNEKTSIGEPMTYANLGKMWSTKIVYANKDAIIDSITKNQITLATAGTGVGKTILIPRIALHAIKYSGTIVCTIPKRLVTKTTAEFVSKCMDVNVGEHVGYSYQGTNETNKRGVVSKLIFTTTGSLISRLTGSDPMLSSYKCIIVDEAHERSVETDQLLLLLKKLCQVRKDFKVIIMSATIDIERFRNYFPSSTFKFGEIDAGKELTFPIKQIFMERPVDWKKMAVEISMKLLRKTAVGDIMIFVKAGGDATQIIAGINKGMADYRKTISKSSRSRRSKKMNNNNSKRNMSNTSGKTKKSSKRGAVPKEYLINPFCIKLDGKSNKIEQKQATSESEYKKLKDEKGYPYSRKIVICTNVAESSLTVDGIVYVIEPGFEYEESYEPNSRVRSLLEHTVSQSSIIQRKGRAGRTRPGVCFHLYSERDFNRFEKFPIPAIEKSDITNNILDLMRLPEANTVKKLRGLLDEFISPPHEKFIISGLKTLGALGAITTITDEGTITPMGMALCKFRSIKVNFARSLIASYFYGCARSMCDIVAIANIANGRIDVIFQTYYADNKKSKEWNKKEWNRYTNVMKGFEHPYGDYMTMLKAYREYLKIAGAKTDEEKVGGVGGAGAVAGGVAGGVAGEELIDFLANDEAEPEIDNIKPSVKKWCREHFLNANKLSQAKKTSQQLYFTLQQVLRPFQAKREPREPRDFNKQLRKLSKAEKEKVVVDEVNSVMDEVDLNFNLDDEIIKEMEKADKLKKEEMEKMQKITYNMTDDTEQTGGYIRQIEKEEEMQRLEPNVMRFEREEDNIMMALAIGNFINFSKKVKPYNDVYSSCFAQDKKLAQANRDTFLRGSPDIVMYDEIFMFIEHAKFLKLNMVNKLPDNVWNRIKDMYGKYIKGCI
jgi:HrpA-like RNA helicase